MTSTLDFTKEVLTNFISAYEAEPCLWQVHHKAYHDKAKKDVAYNKLAQILKSLDHTADKKMVCAKINSLRTNFNKEKKKIQKSVEEGTEEVHTIKLWYYDRLRFLEDQEIPRKSLSDVDYAKREAAADHLQDSSPTHRPDYKEEYSFDGAASPISKHTQYDISIVSHESGTASTSQCLYDSQKRKRNENLAPAPDKHDVFGQNVAFKLRDIKEDRQRIIAEKIINNALYLAQIGELSLESDITKTPPCFSIKDEHDDIYPSFRSNDFQ